MLKLLKARTQSEILPAGGGKAICDINFASLCHGEVRRCEKSSAMKSKLDPAGRDNKSARKTMSGREIGKVCNYLQLNGEREWKE